MNTSPLVLIVDLNNFSRYPTMAVGYLSAVLRKSHWDVEVLSPLAFGVHGFPRIVQEKRWQVIPKFLRHWSAVSRLALINRAREILRKRLQPGNNDDAEIIVDAVKQALQRKPKVVMVSAYTMYRDTVTKIAALCAQNNVPLIVGGNSFVISEIAAEWAAIPGVNAVYAGEPERDLPNIIDSLSRGEDLQGLPGVYRTGAIDNNWVAPPLHHLDSLPFPDYSDFPWDSYPNRIVPVMTGRGCEWGRCTFCSDVYTAAGRTYRTRSLDNVLAEIEHHRATTSAELFVFLDLKLNSDLELWRGLIRELPRVAPGIRWTASVHVDNRDDNGLSLEDLRAAAKAGLTRITCGLESGSPKVLAEMAKGMRLKRMSEFTKNAFAVGLSIRITCMIGHPGESAEDIDMTTKYLQEHESEIERVSLNRFALVPGTPVHQRLVTGSRNYDYIEMGELNTNYGTIPYRNHRFESFTSLMSSFRAISVVNKINTKPLIKRAQEFEGAF